MKIANPLTFAAATAVVLASSGLLAQAVDPNVVGPARRAVAGAADAAGAPGRSTANRTPRGAPRHGAHQ